MREFKLEELCRTSLPLVVQSLKENPNYMPVHCHNAIEMVFIHSGAGWCAVDGVIYPMLAGDLYIIPIGATHEYYSDRNLCYVNCLFNRDIFLENELEIFQFFEKHPQNKMPDKYTFGPHLQRTFHRLLLDLEQEMCSKKTFYLQRSRSLFIEMLIFIQRNAVISPGICSAHAQKNLGRALNYIAEHINEKLTLSQVAAVAGYTPEYFGKLFYKELNISFSRYVIARRLEKVCYDLEHSDSSIEEIAFDNGFYDASYLVKKFKHFCNLTPGEYRARYRENFLSFCQ